MKRTSDIITWASDIITWTLDSLGYDQGLRGGITKTLSIITSIALVTIGALVLTHTIALSTPTLCWVTIGLGGGKIIFDIAADDFSSTKWYKTSGTRPTTILVIVLTVAATSTVGTLGLLGYLSAHQIGWAIVGTVVAGVGTWLILGAPIMLAQEHYEKKG